MANDELRKEKREPDFFERLFGEVAGLSDEELDLLYGALTPGESPTDTIHGIAERAAMEYRKQGKVPAEHVQAALDATRSGANLQGTGPSLLEKLAAPFRGPVSDPVFAHRHLKETTAEDQAILDALSGELEQDWEEGEPK